MTRAKVTADDWRPAAPAADSPDPQLGAALWRFWDAVREQAEHEQKQQRRFARSLQLSDAVIHRPRSWMGWSAAQPAPAVAAVPAALPAAPSRTRPSALGATN